ncbi:hypothetical protein [Paenibacillus sp. DYY-L-2]|uniref:hypothetical protein n=1 Tax=Paenibacillus sp. DYY-L-2 TaxID=3447013 RepID=UPI003F4FBADC
MVGLFFAQYKLGDRLHGLIKPLREIGNRKLQLLDDSQTENRQQQSRKYRQFPSLFFPNQGRDFDPSEEDRKDDNKQEHGLCAPFFERLFYQVNEQQKQRDQEGESEVHRNDRLTEIGQLNVIGKE